MRYQPISKDLFIRNRARFIEHMKPNSIAIFNSNDLMPRSADGFFPFRQNPDLYHLSGIDQEESYLILYPDAPDESMKEMLFLRETNETIAVWEGEKLTKEKGTALSGIEQVHWNDQFNSKLGYIMNFAEHVYINLNENDRSGSEVAYKDLRFARNLKKRYPLHKFERSAPFMATLRAIKQPEEVAIMQDACNITEKAFRRVLDTLKPGMMEYEVEAEIISTFIKNGASGHAYTPIIASGFNACVLHYVTNGMECKDGDLLLMDFGAEYANYASDMSRTIPVNGTFSDRQKEVYNACLKVHHEAKAMLQPGITLNDFNREVKKVMGGVLVDIGLIDKSASEKERLQLANKYMPHGTSHFMGIDVHDIGHRYGKIEENMCFTVEPGIYIREENIGIRIENDIIVKEGKNIDLMKNIPIEVEEIETLMKEGK